MFNAYLGLVFFCCVLDWGKNQDPFSAFMVGVIGTHFLASTFHNLKLQDYKDAVKRQFAAEFNNRAQKRNEVFTLTEKDNVFTMQ